MSRSQSLFSVRSANVEAVDGTIQTPIYKVPDGVHTIKQFVRNPVRKDTRPNQFFFCKESSVVSLARCKSECFEKAGRGKAHDIGEYQPHCGLHTTLRLWSTIPYHRGS